MQSFASPPPTPIPHPTKITHHILYHAPQKGRNYRLYPRPLYQKIHKKGATIAYTHALSAKKTIERAQISPIPAPFLPKNHRKGATIACFGEKYYYLCKKQINHNYYDKQRINRKSL